MSKAVSNSHISLKYFTRAHKKKHSSSLAQSASLRMQLSKPQEKPVTISDQQPAPIDRRWAQRGENVNLSVGGNVEAWPAAPHFNWNWKTKIWRVPRKKQSKDKNKTKKTGKAPLNYKECSKNVFQDLFQICVITPMFVLNLTLQSY